MKKMLNLGLEEGAFHLRLTFGAQKQLRARYDDSVLQIIMAAMDDPDKLSAVLGAALDWPGSGNKVTDGDAFCDLLVDNGYAGPGDFGRLCVDLAEASGLISAKHAGVIKAQVLRALEESLDAFGGGEAPEDPVRPTAAAKH